MWASSRAAAALLLLAAAGCRNDWRTDMWYQPSVRPEDAPRPLPERSVPLGAGPAYESRDDTEDLPNPVPATPASLAHGQAIFVERCAPCHGPDGHGGGPVSRFFPEAPDLAYAKVKARSDGFIWGTISYGGKAMPPAREGLSVRDRWDVVNHVRAVQRTTRGGGAP
ncbi:MAG TPA: c-type cytochrome [Anaeromyxobacteraceae bacterium]|nr:c-type cytochrome [Anaeromyxobacteraceae bacterium]